MNHINIVRSTIKKQLGGHVLKSLHTENWILDLIGVLMCLGSFTMFFILLSKLPFGIMWLLCFIAQGFALQGLGLLAHDAFVHRKIWGDRGSWIGSIIFFYPTFLRPTWYVILHTNHHAYLGTDKDTEAYKQNLDSTWKRLFFLTILGDRMTRLGKLSKDDARMPIISPRTRKERRRLAVERVGLILFALCILTSSILWPIYMLPGYVLPLLIATPVASSLRTILEHADIDPTNEFHLGTYYRTGVITRILFVADSGDCHLVHHIFSHIPWYRMGKAIRLMRPILTEKGVIERQSLLQLLSGWFVRGFPHRSLWFRAAIH